MKQSILTEQDRNDFIAWFKKLILNKPYTIECKVKRKKRTLSQNALYWTWVNCIAKETGNTSDDIHQYLKLKYLKGTKKLIFGDLRICLPSTTKLTTKDFTDFLNAIERDVSAEGIRLLKPEDRYWEQFYDAYSERVM